jgi:hypothetical protein
VISGSHGIIIIGPNFLILVFVTGSKGEENYAESSHLLGNSKNFTLLFKF